MPETGFECDKCKKLIEDKCIKITWSDDDTEYLCNKCFKSFQKTHEQN